MLKQPWVSFSLAGVELTSFGFKIPSPFCSLELSNSEIQSFTSWTLRCTVGGDATRKINIASFEALLYSAAQATSSYAEAQGIPVSFSFGWLDKNGQIKDYASYQGFTLKFKVSTTGLYMVYEISGYASLAVQSSMPVLRIPEVSGVVQPSAIVEALAKAVKATSYYLLDIDHNDAPTLVSHGALTTSFRRYVAGSYNGQDEYHEFPGLLPLSKSYNGTREAGGLKRGIKKLSTLVNNLSVTPLSEYLRKSNTDTAPQCSSFSFWIDEPTMTRPGVIHYKSNAGLTHANMSDTLEYGTANTNILSLNGSYDGVAYNMTDMKFSSIGFTLDTSGNAISQKAEIVNSWSSSLADVFQTVNIINDVSALASQFSGNFTVTIPGNVRQYTIAQPVSLLVMSGNTTSPITGIYNIMSVSHSISNSFVTTLKLQRLVLSSANQVAAAQGIYVSGSSNYPRDTYHTTKNIITPYKVIFGNLYPTFEHMVS